MVFPVYSRSAFSSARTSGNCQVGCQREAGIYSGFASPVKTTAVSTPALTPQAMSV